ncbi:hypothetical protein KEJ48_07140, partial [Candidatus Bathyarchaeota archaeon]|nr:hypothetical protein [Candidatus Bathyarchaeota archaeon]
MPRELVLTAPRTLEFREYEEPSLEAKQIRVKSILTAEKHGTSLAIYRGESPFHVKRYDDRLKLFMPLEEEEKRRVVYPCHVGNMTVGVV